MIPEQIIGEAQEVRKQPARLLQAKETQPQTDAWTRRLVLKLNSECNHLRKQFPCSSHLLNHRKNRRSIASEASSLSPTSTSAGELNASQPSFSSSTRCRPMGRGMAQLEAKAIA